MQGELFELTVANLTNASGTLRLRCTGIASDRFKYAIKRTSDHPLLPASEWFCHRLAEAVHLPTPVYRKLRLEEDGSLAFGSRWESGAKQFGDISPDDRIRFFKTGINVCRIIGLDLFLPNGDRNLSNFLWHVIDDQAIAMTFDYSEGWIMHGPLQDTPALDSNCLTFRVINWLKQIGGYRSGDIADTLRRLSLLSSDAIRMIAASMPEEWLPEGGKAAIIDWWESPEVQGRLAVLIAQHPCEPATNTPSCA